MNIKSCPAPHPVALGPAVLLRVPSAGLYLQPLRISFSPCIIDDIDTLPLPGRFVTSFVDWNFLIIALMVEMEIFNALKG